MYLILHSRCVYSVGTVELDERYVGYKILQLHLFISLMCPNQAISLYLCYRKFVVSNALFCTVVI
jgi:hypothetical protein